MRFDISHRKWAILIFGVALFIRLIYLLQIKDNPFFYSPMVDELWNIRWATDLLQKDFWGTGVYFRGPLYPYLLALVLKITGFDYFWSRLLQLVMASASVSLVYLLGREFFSDKVARLGSIFAAFYGTLIFYDTMFLIPVLFVFLNLLGLLVIARNRDNPRKRPFLIAGLIFGISALARPNILVIVPFLALWLFFHFRKKIEVRSIVILLLVFFIGVALPITPVTVRNMIVANDAVLISSQGGINLYLGNNNSAEGLTMMMPEIFLDARVSWDKFIPTITDYAEKTEGRSLKPSEVSSFWTNKAKQFIFENPGKFIGLTCKKFIYLFCGFENSDQSDIYEFRKYSSLMSVLIFDKVLKFPFGLFAPLGLLGIGLCFRRRREMAPLLIFVAAYIPTIILFLVTARHRLTIIPILLLFAAYALIYLWQKTDLRKTVYATIALILLLMISNTNTFDLGFRNIPQHHYNLALTYARQGDYKNTIKEYKLALEKAPMAAVINYGLGTAYSEIDMPQEALPYLRQAVTIDPEYTDAIINLGRVHFELGQIGQAENAFLRASYLSPDRVEPYVNLGDLYFINEDLDLARRNYSRATQLQPDNYVLFTKLGVLYGRVGDTTIAYDYFRKSLQLDSSYSPGYLNWGNICLLNGDTTMAIEKYRSAIYFDSLAAEPYYNLAILYIRLGDLKKARENVNTLLEIAPDFSQGIELKKKLGG